MDYTHLHSLSNIVLNKAAKKNFLFNIIPVIGSIPVVSNKASECLKNLTKMQSIDTPNGHVNVKQVMAAVKILNKYSRSTFCPPDVWRYKAMTPIVMHAIQEIQGTKYEYWDKEDSMLHYLFGYGTFSSYNLASPLVGELASLSRDQLITARAAHLQDKTELDYRVSSLANLKGPTLTKQILLQLWAASPHVREPNVMILDLHNWDSTPEAFEQLPGDKKEEEWWEFAI